MFFKIKPSLNPQGSKYIIENDEIVNFETGQLVSEKEICEKEISLDKIHQSFFDLSSNDEFLIENAGHVDLTEGQIAFQKTFEGDYCTYSFNIRKVDYRVLVNKKDNTVTLYSDRFGNIRKVPPKEYFSDFKEFSNWIKGNKTKVWKNIYDVIYSDYYGDKVKKADKLAIKLKSKLNVSIVFEFTDGEFVMISDSRTYYKDEVKVRPKNSNGKLKVFKNLKDFESKNSEKAQLIKQSMFINESVLSEAFDKQVEVEKKLDESFKNGLSSNRFDDRQKEPQFLKANGNNPIGAFSTKIANADFFIGELNDWEKSELKKDNVKLKSGEYVFRYATLTTMAGGISPFVKINFKKGLIYYLTDESSESGEEIVFETKGVKATYINLDSNYTNKYSGTESYQEPTY